MNRKQELKSCHKAEKKITMEKKKDSGNDGRRAKCQGVSMWGANGKGTKVASNFSLLSSEMTLQI